MALPENPSGRDLAVFANDLRRAAVRVSQTDVGEETSRTLFNAALLVDHAADERFVAEIRGVLRADFEANREAEAVQTIDWHVNGPTEALAFKDGWHVTAELGLTIHYDAKRKLVHVSR